MSRAKTWCLLAAVVVGATLSGCATGAGGASFGCTPDVATTGNLSPDIETTTFANPPELLNREAVARAIPRAYPRRLMLEGCGGTTLVWLHVLPDGSTDAIRVHTSSGYSQIDDAAQQVARVMEFAPALDATGAPIAAWFTVPVTMQMSAGAAVRR